MHGQGLCWPSFRISFLASCRAPCFLFSSSPCPPPLRHRLVLPRSRARQRSSPSPPNKRDSPDDSPVETVRETEEEARRRHWIKRFWAPWEEKLSPEAQFAVESLRLGKEEPIIPKEMMDRLSVNTPLIPDNYMELEVKEHPDEVEGRKRGALPGTAWRKQMVFALIPPRDWPPPGWKVDADELAFIRGALALENARVSTHDLEKAAPLEEGQGNFERWTMFLKQYDEWVAANKDLLDKEEEETGDEYYPGRRRTGKNYTEGMYELPFIYPGQHFMGEVTMIHLYEGAFVNFGAVHDGWVPIRRNDWYWIRDHIKVGMRVQVEVIAKRDPYRFRFPVEMRFVHPNVDHLIFNRFKHPPINFYREDTNIDEVTREAGRPYSPWREPEPEDVELQQMLKKHMMRHPYIFRIWQLHQAEQMVLDDEERRAGGGGPVERVEIDEVSKRRYINEDSYVTEEMFGGAKVPSLVLNVHEWELDMEGARKERQAINKAREEAQSRGEKFKFPKLKRDLYMEELDLMHLQRYLDENEALERDKICRLEFGLPFEEPGRYADHTFWGQQYNPREKRWRHDYIGEVKSKEDDSRREHEFRPRPSEIIIEEQDEIGPDTWESSPSTGGEFLQYVGPDKDEDEESSTGDSTKSGEARGLAGDKVVNGTESSRVVDRKGMFRIREEQTDGDETDAPDNMES